MRGAVRRNAWWIIRGHRERLGFELRLTILGYVQRGGIPSAFDRCWPRAWGGRGGHLARGKGVLMANERQHRRTPLETA
jgi:6-phosphofructokinase 1